MEFTDQELRILSYVKNSLGMMLDDQDDFLKANIKATERSVKGRIGSEEGFYEDNFLYELAVAQLAVSNYMNRGATTDVNLYVTEKGFQEYILDLKADYAAKYPNDTEDVSDG